MSTIENLCSGKDSNNVTGKILVKSLKTGKINPNVRITKASRYSLLTNKLFVRESIENSEVKNQNSSILANGSETPKSNKTNSSAVKSLARVYIIGLFFTIFDY